MNKKAGFQNLLLLLLFQSGPLLADTVVDVSHEWQEHQSTSPVRVAPDSAPAAPKPVSAPEANRCICESQTTPEKLEACTYAFTGMVIGASPPKKGSRTVAFDVDEIFKGAPKDEMEVQEEVTGTDCDLPFEQGQSYLVYARWEWGTVVTSRCMGTKLLERTAIQSLGPSESLKDKLYIHLRNACMGRVDTPCCLSSLKAMRADYDVPEPDEGCPAGMVPDRLACGGSYTWCIPAGHKNHREAATP